MTKNEKATLMLSIVALLVSVISPFVAYQFLDPTLKQFSLRGRLLVSNPELSGGAAARALLLSGSPTPIEFNIEVVNIGELPANGIQVVAQYYAEAKEGGVTFEPPVQYEIRHTGSQTFITLKRSLAPQDKLKISFADEPKRVVVSNEFGESSILDNISAIFSHAIQISNENLKELEKDRKRLEKEIANEKKRK